MKTRLWLLIAGTAAFAACSGTGATPGEANQAVREQLPALVNDAFAAMQLAPYPASARQRVVQALADGQQGEALAAFFARVLTDANHEGDGVFKLGPALCAGDATCLDAFTRFQIKLRAVMVGGGVDFSLLVGADQAAPVVAELRADRVAILIDLADLRRALGEVAGPDAHLPDVMRGKLAVTFTRLTRTAVKLDVAVRQAVEIGGQTPSGGKYSLATEARDPLLSVTAELKARTAGVALDLGHTRIVAPMAAKSELVVDWAGLTGIATLLEGSGRVTIRGLGAGDRRSSVKLDGTEIFGLDLNAAGRKVDVSVQTGELPIFRFASGVALDVMLHLQNLRALGHAVPAALTGGAYHIALDGPAPSLQLVPALLRAHFPGGLRVTGGTHLIEDAHGDSFGVRDGRCLTAAGIATPKQDPLLGILDVVRCP